MVHISFLANKTVFLLALATGRRRGELHALVDRISHPENWSSVTLKPAPSFLLKAYSVNHSELAFTEVTVPALSTIVAGDDSERTLCPVRALRWYLERTRDQRKTLQALVPLLIPIYPGKKTCLQPATLGSWVRSIIQEAYASSTDEDARLLNRPLHELRAIGPSWNYYKTLKHETVLRAALWSSHTTFTSHYLRDLTMVEEEMLRLGPIVTAQHIMTVHQPTASRESQNTGASSLASAVARARDAPTQSKD